MKQKYGIENWFKAKIFSQETMSVKEALRVLIVPSLEKQMVKCFCDYILFSGVLTIISPETNICLSNYLNMVDYICAEC